MLLSAIHCYRIVPCCCCLLFNSYYRIVPCRCLLLEQHLRRHGRPHGRRSRRGGGGRRRSGRRGELARGAVTRRIHSHAQPGRAAVALLAGVHVQEAVAAHRRVPAAK